MSGYKGEREESGKMRKRNTRRPVVENINITFYIISSEKYYKY